VKIRWESPKSEKVEEYHEYHDLDIGSHPEHAGPYPDYMPTEPSVDKGEIYDPDVQSERLGEEVLKLIKRLGLGEKNDSEQRKEEALTYCRKSGELTSDLSEEERLEVAFQYSSESLKLPKGLTAEERLRIGMERAAVSGFMYSLNRDGDNGRMLMSGELSEEEAAEIAKRFADARDYCIRNEKVPDNVGKWAQRRVAVFYCRAKGKLPEGLDKEGRMDVASEYTLGRGENDARWLNYLHDEMEQDEKEEVVCRDWKKTIEKGGLRDTSPPEGLGQEKLYDLADYYCMRFGELPKWLTSKEDRIEVAVRYMLATGGATSGRVPRNMAEEEALAAENEALTREILG
jgi:hypothetical protein